MTVPLHYTWITFHYIRVNHKERKQHMFVQISNSELLINPNAYSSLKCNRNWRSRIKKRGPPIGPESRTWMIAVPIKKQSRVASLP